MDAAIEFLIAEQGMGSSIENDSETASAAMESTELLREAIETLNEEESGSCSNLETVLAKCSLQTDEKVCLLHVNN